MPAGFGATFDGAHYHRFATQWIRGSSFLLGLLRLAGNALLSEPLSKASRVHEIVQLSRNHFLQHDDVAIDESSLVDDV